MRETDIITPKILCNRIHIDIIAMIIITCNDKIIGFGNNISKKIPPSNISRDISKSQSSSTLNLNKDIEAKSSSECAVNRIIYNFLTLKKKKSIHNTVVSLKSKIFPYFREMHISSSNTPPPPIELLFRYFKLLSKWNY